MRTELDVAAMTQAARLNSPRHLSPTSSVRTFAFVVLRTAQIVLIAAALSAVAAFAVGGLVLHMAISPVLTGSMQPAFSPGDAVITRLVDAHSLHKGDIAVFVPPGESAPYAHRITNVTEKNGHVVVTTKGDANPAPDRWHASLNGDQVQVVVAHVPHFGRVMAWTAEPWMRALTIALVGLVFTAIGTTAILRGGDSRSRRTRIPLTTN